MIGRVRESRNPKKVIRVTLMESYGEIRRVPVNLYDNYREGNRLEVKRANGGLPNSLWDTYSFFFKL